MFKLKIYKIRRIIILNENKLRNENFIIFIFIDTKVLEITLFLNLCKSNFLLTTFNDHLNRKHSIIVTYLLLILSKFDQILTKITKI